ncbi:purine-nucleoside phosphorylase [Maritalea sp.]|uniref:purine-nucleoside phosphorylase n=1 Tax=Maritalea sp. TaxID=2003361 RepID=UPI003EF8E481
MTPHNNAKPDDYAETVLLPGDPLRAKWVADTFLQDVKLVNSVRNCLGYTGTFNGKPVSVQATGMGQPSLAIYVNELIDKYEVKNLIRIGTCGGLNKKVKVRDLVLGASASTESKMFDHVFGHFTYAPHADFGLMRKAADLADSKEMKWHAGGIVSSDSFYQPKGIESYQPLIDHDILAVEMEAAALYTIASAKKCRAIAICTMTDCILTGDEIDAEQRQSSLTDMAQLSLELATQI